MSTVTAIATLGPSKAGKPVSEPQTKGTYAFTVKFPTSFSSAPVVLATPLQGTDYPPNIADTFAITVVTVTTTSFTVNVNRVDMLNGGWDQNLRLQYTASTPA